MDKKLKIKKTETCQSENDDLSRRKFLQTGLKVLGGLAILELGGASLLYLRARSLEGEFGGIITVGKIDEFSPGSVVEIEDANFYLVRDAEGGFMAIYRRCPHLGCTVNWISKKGKFYCPCHAASFDQHGEFNSQLVSRALDIFPVFFENDMVKVDTTQVQARPHHLSEHVVYKPEL
jgi:cytochrome b6-f complex iron-sulfur subunit